MTTTFLSRGGRAAAAAAVLVACAVATAPSSVAAGTYPIANAFGGYAQWVASPTSDPAGVNIACTPSAAHPRPVVLLEGSGSRTIASFARLGPKIANAGYCVYALNYGETQATSASNGLFGALGDIAVSAGQVKTFVDQVLAKSGASKVDIVGWSQGGGPLPRYYIQNLGGASKVASLVALAPSNYGTSLFGILTLGASLERATNVPLLDTLGASAYQQQLAGGPFIAALNKDGDTRPGVKYTVIETRYDDVVTPYTNAFLTGPGARNILLQDACPFDITDHFGIPYDDNAAQYVLNALGPDDPNFRPRCVPALPFGGSF